MDMRIKIAEQLMSMKRFRASSDLSGLVSRTEAEPGAPRRSKSKSQQAKIDKEF
jgi:hypothetical protein